MYKTKVKIPHWVNYLSDWSKEFDLTMPKNEHYILNKMITGCGATEYFLNNNNPVILCAPRKILLQNKHNQQEKHRFQTFLVINDGEPLSVKDSIWNYLSSRGYGNPAKILITYDSLGLLIDVLREHNITYIWQVVVDEFHIIMEDSRLKPDTEIQLLQDLQHFPSVCFLSATPTIEAYLDKIPEFSNLPYYEMEWHPSHIIKPNLEIREINSFHPYLKKEIDNYLNGNYPKKLWNNMIVESRQLVIFVNNVSFIVSLLKKIPGLTAANTNIICSDCDENKAVLKKAGHQRGAIPKESEPHKMFTFCTKTSYIGSDFYHTSARTIICSDPNMNCMSTDIATDYPQICGRQRNQHPFQHDIVFLFKTKKKLLPQEEFQQIIQEKINRTEAKIRTCNNAQTEYDRKVLLEDFRAVINTKHYETDYLSIVHMADGTVKAVQNNLVMLTEIRGYELQNMIYSNKFAVYSALGGSSSSNPLSPEEERFMQCYDSLSHFPERMKLFCSYADAMGETAASQLSIDNCYGYYWKSLGTVICEKACYSKTKMDEYIQELSCEQSIKNAVLSAFDIGGSYKNKEIKSCLQQIYTDNGSSRTAKAVDLGQYFIVQRKRIGGDEGLLLTNVR